MYYGQPTPEPVYHVSLEAKDGHKIAESPAASSTRTYAVSPESLAPSPAGTFEVVSPAPLTPAATPADTSLAMASYAMASTHLGGAAEGTGTVELWLFPSPSSPQPPPHSLAGFSDLETGTLLPTTPITAAPYTMFHSAMLRALARAPILRLGESFLVPAKNRYGIDPEWDAWECTIGLSGGVFLHFLPSESGSRFRGLRAADVSSKEPLDVFLGPYGTRARLETTPSSASEPDLLSDHSRAHGPLPALPSGVPQTVIVTLPDGTKTRVPSGAVFIAVPKLLNPREMKGRRDPASWFKAKVSPADLARRQRRFIKSAPAPVAKPVPAPAPTVSGAKRRRSPGPEPEKKEKKEKKREELELEAVGDDVFDFFSEPKEKEKAAAPASTVSAPVDEVVEEPIPDNVDADEKPAETEPEPIRRTFSPLPLPPSLVTRQYTGPLSFSPTNLDASSRLLRGLPEAEKRVVERTVEYRRPVVTLIEKPVVEKVIVADGVVLLPDGVSESRPSEQPKEEKCEGWESALPHLVFSDFYSVPRDKERKGDAEVWRWVVEGMGGMGLGLGGFVGESPVFLVVCGLG